MAQHAWFWNLLVMSSQIPWYLSNLLSQSSSQESVKIRSACMAPRASAIKEQGFSKAVAVGIEAQRGSSRSVIADNWVCHQFQHNENLFVFWFLYFFVVVFFPFDNFYLPFFFNIVQVHPEGRGQPSPPSGACTSAGTYGYMYITMWLYITLC